MIDAGAVQNLLHGWWFDYDQGNFDAWPAYFAPDARFTCRSDSGDTPFESFFAADITGAKEVLEWQEDHRRNSPYPLRHNGTNIHVTSASATEAEFRSYIFVTHLVEGAVANLSSGVCRGRVRIEDGALRIAELRLILDFASSETFGAGTRSLPD